MNTERKTCPDGHKLTVVDAQFSYCLTPGDAEDYQAYNLWRTDADGNARGFLTAADTLEDVRIIVQTLEG